MTVHLPDASGPAGRQTIVTCRECGDRDFERIASYPCGDPRSQIVAAYVAAEDGADTHTHIDPAADAVVVVRPLESGEVSP